MTDSSIVIQFHIAMMFQGPPVAFGSINQFKFAPTRFSSSFVINQFSALENIITGYMHQISKIYNKKLHHRVPWVQIVIHETLPFAHSTTISYDDFHLL